MTYPHQSNMLSCILRSQDGSCAGLSIIKSLIFITYFATAMVLILLLYYIYVAVAICIDIECYRDKAAHSIINIHSKNIV
jgi:hypothetical protein